MSLPSSGLYDGDRLPGCQSQLLTSLRWSTQKYVRTPTGSGTDGGQSQWNHSTWRSSTIGSSERSIHTEIKYK